MALTAEEALELQELYVEQKQALDEIKTQLEETKQRIIDESGGVSFNGRLLSYTVGSRIGSVDNTSLYRFHDITTEEVNAFRREPTVTHTIKVNTPVV